MNPLTHTNKYLIYTLFLIIIAYPLFGVLDQMPVRLWDESRLAMNAYEMSRSGNWLVTTFEGAPDMWNTKPPLLIWIQALFIKIFGFGPLALRIPVALACALTVYYLFRFLSKGVQNYMLGFIATIVLVSSAGYVCEHVARTGDFDGLLILFTTLSCLSFFNFIEKDSYRYLYYFFIFLTLAVLAKSIAGLLFLPAIFIYIICRKKLVSVLKSKHFYLGLLLFITPVILYYVLREHYNPGYFKTVMENEFGGRYFKTLENHNNPFDFYYVLIYEQHFRYWLPITLIGIPIALFHKQIFIRRLGSFSLLCIICFSLVISYSKTKLLWYDAPIYPFLAIITAIPIYTLYAFIAKPFSDADKWKRLLPVLGIIIVFIIPYFSTTKRITELQELPEKERVFAISRYIIKGIKGEVPVNGYKVVAEGYVPHIMAYIYMANEKGINLARIPREELQPGDKLIVEEDPIKELIKQKFDYQLLHN
ncbi:MAG: glycosyltransferase family 39 protein [Taibaiella sp.]|nr:glycosyltransferase family 39 protein [Taibaiella sp.]